MSGREAEAALASIPRGADGPTFPAPWAARAFALTVALNERGAFSWSEWSAILGREVAELRPADSGDADAYWHAWLAALEAILVEKQLAPSDDLVVLQDAWRDAAAQTPHGQPIDLPHRASTQ